MNRNRKEVVFVITSEAKIEAGDNDLDLNLAGVNVEACLRVNPAGGMVVWYKKGRNISVWEGSLQQHEECG